MLLYNLITYKVIWTTFMILLFLFELKPLVPMGSNFMEKNHQHSSLKILLTVIWGDLNNNHLEVNYFFEC